MGHHSDAVSNERMLLLFGLCEAHGHVTHCTTACLVVVRPCCGAALPVFCSAGTVLESLELQVSYAVTVTDFQDIVGSRMWEHEELCVGLHGHNSSQRLVCLHPT
jgi:hypothetical protein